MKQVILDTDVGSDIDDLFAIGMLLNSPELNVELILTATGNTPWRAAELCKFLELSGHTEKEVGIGLSPEEQRKKIRVLPLEWLGDYSWHRYPGRVYEDGVARAIEILESCENPVIVAIAPLTNIAEICRRRPDLIAKCELVAMSGSLRKKHLGQPGKTREYNIVTDLPAARTVYAAPWKKFTITPLDSCGLVILGEAENRRLQEASAPVICHIMENFRFWKKELNYRPEVDGPVVLYDTVAVHLAWSDRFWKMESLRLKIDAEGLLQEDPAGNEVTVAADWLDYPAYREDLLTRLCRS